MGASHSGDGVDGGLTGNGWDWMVDRKITPPCSTYEHRLQVFIRETHL